MLKHAFSISSPYLELARDRCPRGGWAVLWRLELALACYSRLLTCIKTQVYVDIFLNLIPCINGQVLHP
jgi:hypothetical protein